MINEHWNKIIIKNNTNNNMINKMRPMVSWKMSNNCLNLINKNNRFSKRKRNKEDKEKESSNKDFQDD
jgi:hypothetical protein